MMSNSEVALELRIKDLMKDLNEFYSEEQQRNSNSSIPTELLDDDCSDSGSVSTLGTIGSTRIMNSTQSKPGTRQFNQEMASKLHSHRKSLCIQDNDSGEVDTNINKNSNSNSNIVAVDVDDDDVVKSEVDDFVAAFDPNEMRCLALVSHNEMKVKCRTIIPSTSIDVYYISHPQLRH